MDIVIATPRTGSYWFCNYIAKKTGQQDLGEYMISSAGIPPYMKDIIPPIKSNNIQERVLETYNYLLNNNNSVLKIFPYQFRSFTQFETSSYDPETGMELAPIDQKHMVHLEDAIFGLADNIHILTRKDFQAQCESFYLAALSDNWHGDPEEYREVTIDITLWNERVFSLKKMYEVNSYYYKRYNCEIVDYSELPFEKSSTSKYIKNIKWLSQPPTEDFDVMSLFSNS